MMRGDGSIEAMLAAITSVEEIEAFSLMLRKPPPGVRVKACSEAQWQKIARRKIELQKREAKR